MKWTRCVATGGGMPKTSVMMGKATAAPPSEVAPASMDPKIIVTDMKYLHVG